MLSFNKWIAIAIAMLAITQTVAGVYEAVVAHQIGTFSKLANHSIWTGTLHLSGSALCDIIITLCMVYYLKKSQIGFRKFNEFLAKLVRITMETGALCTVMAILDLALFLGFKGTNYHTVPAAVISKLYANSLFVILNARAGFESVNVDVHSRSTTSVYLSFASTPDTRRESETFRSRLSRVRESYARERDYEHFDLPSPSAGTSYGGTQFS
ncbi:hypothetical protein QCA50_007477 [Cerrena zonata]|uniref:DUF6534 domain-containing protein n=1 Tax=Cerrena zonata TaxID=2478898 RepID=A0AAW0GIE7_9APHY